MCEKKVNWNKKTLLLLILDVLMVSYFHQKQNHLLKVLLYLYYMIYLHHKTMFCSVVLELYYTQTCHWIAKKEHVAPPSCVASAYGLDVGAGVIDPDYTGQIKILVFNHGKYQVYIKAGVTRVVQLIVECAKTLKLEIKQGFLAPDQGVKGFVFTGLLY